MRYGMNSNQIMALFNRLELGFLYFDSNLVADSITLTAAQALHLPESVLDCIRSGKLSEAFYMTARSMDSCPELYEYALQVLHTAASVSFDYTDQDKTPWHIRLVPDLCTPCKADGVYVLFFNITRYKGNIDQLLINEELNRIISEISNCGIWEYDPETKALNQIKKLNGRYSNENLLIPDYHTSVLSWNLVHPEDIPLFDAYCESMDNGDEEFEYTLRAIGDNDEYIWMRFYGHSVRDSEGKLIKVVGRTTNVTDEKEGWTGSASAVRLDPLTEVLNQSALRENIERCIDRNINYRNEVHAMLLLDLDNFRDINETFGHLYGDLLLENYAEMLHGFCSASDVIGRSGGDEFLIYMKNIQNLSEPVDLAKRIIKRTQDGLREQKADCRLSVSIGISFYPSHGIEFNSLFQAAEVALYTAKQAGKSTYCIFEEAHPDIELPKSKLLANTQHDEWVRKTSMSFVENNIANFALDVFSDGEDVGTAVNRIFREIGKFYDISRIAILMQSPETGQMQTYYLWCNEGSEIPIQRLNECSKISFDRYRYLFDDRHVCVFDDIAAADIDTETRTLLNGLGTQALLQYALFDDSNFYGTINISDIRKPRVWSAHEIDTLVTVSRIIGTFLLREKSKEELDKNLFYIRSLIKSQKLTNYAIDAKTYELLYFSEYTGTLFPNIRLGQPCYQEIKKSSKVCSNCPLYALQQSGNTYIEMDSYDEEHAIWHNTTATRDTSPAGRDIFLISQSNVTNFMEKVYSRDQLTGIATYYRFDVDASALLLDRVNSKRRYALLYLNIAKFKFINDEWGYSTGDEILTILAETVSAKLEEGELICRVASDQFAALLQYTNPDALTRRIQRVDYVISSIFKTKFPNITLIITSGLYLFGKTDTLVSAALDKARLAQETVKNSHKSTLAVYNKTLHRQLTREKEIEFQMNSALENGEFFIVLQPKVDAATGRIHGAEALVRWNRSGELISPSEFVPLFERNGFIVDLDFYVYELVFRTLRAWLNEGRVPPVTSVNVSRRHLEDNGFIYRLLDLLKKYKLPASYIELELTESLINDNMDRLLLILDELRALGFLVSIDDFGSGFSSLNLIQSLSADIIKLDKAFFLQNSMTGNRRTILLSMIHLIKGLGMKVVCEGVETEEQALFLAENQCDLIQGYYYFAPLSVDDFGALDW